MAGDPVQGGSFTINQTEIYRFSGAELYTGSSYTITSTGVIIDGEVRWTYSGGQIFLGLGHYNDTVPLSGFAVGDSGTSDGWSLFVITATRNDYFTCTNELKSIADAIRTKGGTSASLTYPSGFVTAINNLPTKVLGTLSINQGTPFDIQISADDYSGGDWDGFSSVSINISTPFYDGSCDIIDPPQPINFTIGGTTYSAMEGMTWAEWVSSSYNTIGCYLINFGSQQLVSGSDGFQVVGYTSTHPVYANHIIGLNEPQVSTFTTYVWGLY